MRVGLGCTSIEPSVRPFMTGISIYTKNLQHYLPTEKLAVVPYCYPPCKSYLKSFKLNYSQSMPLPYSLSTLLSITCPFYSGPHLNDINHSPIDLFHAPDFLIPKLQHTPVVATLHDAFLLQYPQWYNPHLLHLKMAVLKKTVQFADHIITISQAITPSIIKFYKIKEENISVIPLGVSEDWFMQFPEQQLDDVLKPFNLRPGFILYAGNLQMRKNITGILAAFAQLPASLQQRHPLVLVGDFPWKTPGLEQQVIDFAQQPHVLWIKHLPFHTLRAFFQAAEVFLFPSLAEGFGMPILEAFAAQTPVITSNQGACAEVAEDGACLIDPYDVNFITKTLKQLLQDIELKDQCKERGHAIAKRQTWQQTATQTRKVYEKLVL